MIGRLAAAETGWVRTARTPSFEPRFEPRSGRAPWPAVRTLSTPDSFDMRYRLEPDRVRGRKDLVPRRSVDSAFVSSTAHRRDVQESRRSSTPPWRAVALGFRIDVARRRRHSRSARPQARALVLRGPLPLASREPQGWYPSTVAESTVIRSVAARHFACDDTRLRSLDTRACARAIRTGLVRNVDRSARDPTARCRS